MPETIQPNGRPQNPIDDTPLLKMKELVAESGISKATILYYINVGLLPKPVKTNPNVAYYPASYIEKLGYIKQLQSRHRLSLSQIKFILREREKGREVTPLIELNEVVFGQKVETAWNQASFCRMCGLSKKEAERAVTMNLLNPKEPGRFDAEDVAVGKLLKRSLELGITLRQLAFYPAFAAQIVEHEIQVRKDAIAGKPFKEMVAITMELTSIARSFRGYVIDRIFQESVGSQGLSGDLCE